MMGIIHNGRSVLKRYHLGREVDHVVQRGRTVFVRPTLPVISNFALGPTYYRSENHQAGLNLNIGADVADATSVSLTKDGAAISFPNVGGNAYAGTISMPSEDADFELRATNAEGTVSEHRTFYLTTNPAITYFREGAGAHQSFNNFIWFIEGAYTGHPVNRATLTIGSDPPIELVGGTNWQTRYPPAGFRKQHTSGISGTAYNITCILRVYGPFTGIPDATSSFTVQVPA